MNLTPALQAGNSRLSVTGMLAPLLERRLVFCMGLEGGYDDGDGNHWIWQSAEALRSWLLQFHGIQASNDTVNRALQKLVESGRWIRAQLGRRFGHRAYYYRPAAPIPQVAESIPQQAGIDSAMQRSHTETTSGKTVTDPGRCAVAEPSEPQTRPVKRGDRPDPTHYQSQAAQAYVAPDWAQEHVQVMYAELNRIVDKLEQPQDGPEQPGTDESPTEPTEQPSRLDSRPAESIPVELETDIVTDQSSAVACDALNSAKGRGWVWVASDQQFRHRILPMRRTVAEMARLYDLSEAQLQQVLEGIGDAGRKAYRHG